MGLKESSHPFCLR